MAAHVTQGDESRSAEPPDAWPAQVIFGQQPVRFAIIDGQPWWVAADVGAVLDITDVRGTMRRFPASEKGIHAVDTLGGRQELLVLNEPGLYRLVFRSRKPEAERFKTWIFSEVIPSIRRHGVYPPPAEPELPELSAPAVIPERIEPLPALPPVRPTLSYSPNLIAAVVGRFFDECCTHAPGQRIKAEEFHKAYLAWAGPRGQMILTPKMFGMHIKRWLSSTKSGCIVYLDVTVSVPAAPLVLPAPPAPAIPALPAATIPVLRALPAPAVEPDDSPPLEPLGPLTPHDFSSADCEQLARLYLRRSRLVRQIEEIDATFHRFREVIDEVAHD